MGLMGTLVFFSVNLVWLLMSSSYFTSSFAYPFNYGLQHGYYAHTPHQAEVGSKYKMHAQESPSEKRERVNTVLVTCHPDFMEIIVKADLFGVGAPVNGDELRLGVENDESCRSTPSSDDEYKFIVGLLGCGMQHWMTEDSLIYTNLLVYSPVASLDGVIRMEEAVIPVECHYDRKYSLHSSSLSPTWIPFTSTKTAVETLKFDLRLMTTDWLYERSSNVFYTGEPICIEASVRVGHHRGLRVFISSCVATLKPDRDSTPRYNFIENDGCLVDSQHEDSNSQFLPRTRDDELQLVIDAFRFRDAERLYITCLLGAVPVAADATQKACTFTNGRWWSADGNDYSCGYCQSQNELSQTHGLPSNFGSFGPRSHGRSGVPKAFRRGGVGTVWENEQSVGLVLVLPGRNIQTRLPSRTALHGSKWRSGMNMTTALDKGLVPEYLPTPEPKVGENETIEMAGMTSSPKDEDWSNEIYFEVEENVTALTGSPATPMATTSSKELTPATSLEDSQ